MHIVCTDLEGIFVPEIWINVAEKTGIEDLKLTTRDIPDYNVLMRRRLAILKKNGLKLGDITEVVATMAPLAGAEEFLNWLRARVSVIVVSDTYVEFIRPLMAKLGWPTLFCHDLSLGHDGSIENYNLRQPDSKYRAVLALKNLNFTVISIGDSYNDITMLKEADHGFLFRPPENVRQEYPQFPVSTTYTDLTSLLSPVLKDPGPA
ncbi:MAG: bifunctional phosphoserine phosphatase/homoserine phosphotransferase ThrH [Desulfobacterales bacterium]